MHWSSIKWHSNLPNFIQIFCNRYIFPSIHFFKKKSFPRIYIRGRRSRRKINHYLIAAQTYNAPRNHNIFPRQKREKKKHEKTAQQSPERILLPIGGRPSRSRGRAIINPRRVGQKVHLPPSAPGSHSPRAASAHTSAYVKRLALTYEYCARRCALRRERLSCIYIC